MKTFRIMERFGTQSFSEVVNRLVDSLLWEKRERKSRRDAKPKQRKDVVVVSESMLLYKYLCVCCAKQPKRLNLNRPNRNLLTINVANLRLELQCESAGSMEGKRDMYTGAQMSVTTLRYDAPSACADMSSEIRCLQTDVE